jgi:hypothetical protein
MLTFINILLNYLHSVQFCLLLLIIGCLFFYRVWASERPTSWAMKLPVLSYHSFNLAEDNLTAFRLLPTVTHPNLSELWTLECFWQTWGEILIQKRKVIIVFQWIIRSTMLHHIFNSTSHKSFTKSIKIKKICQWKRKGRSIWFFFIASENFKCF